MEKNALKQKPKQTDQQKIQKQQPVKTQKKGFNYYKRSVIRHFSSVISLMILIPVFGLTALFLLVFPRSDISYIEKRELAKFPEFSFDNYFSGAFTAGITNYYDDTVPYRDDFKNTGNSFKSNFGIQTGDSVSATGNLKAAKKKESSESSTNQSNSNKTSETSKNSAQTNILAEESKQKDYTKENAEYTVENGIIVVKQDGHYRALEMFGGGTGDAYVDALNSFQSKVNSNVKVYSMIAPLASEYYTPANYEEFTANQKQYFDDIASRLDRDIITVDIDSVLAKHTEENIYLRTDHHWTPLAAYYSAEAFASAANVNFKNLNTFTKRNVEGFVGTMYAFTGDINIKNDPEIFTYYIPDNNDKCTTYYYDTAFNYRWHGDFFNDVGDPQSNAYMIFMGGDEQVVKIKTNVTNKRRLLIVKDSYGNAEPACYMNSFEEIYVVDMRYFDLNLVDFTEQMGITDVLFTMVTFSAFGDNAENLNNLITQEKGQTLVDNSPKEEQTT